MLIESVSVDTTGAAGSATGEASTPRIRGLLYKIDLDYNGSAPATTDVTITTVDDDGNTVDTLLTISNSNTDADYSPMIPGHDNTGTITGDYLLPPIPLGTIKVTVAQCDALTAAVVAKVFFIPLGSVQNKGAVQPS
jgi:hypothetical protein